MTTTMMDSYSFVNGDFASGKIRDIQLLNKVYAIQCQGESLLVIGTGNELLFYSLKGTTLVYAEPQPAMVSGIQWLNSNLLVVSRLDGSLSLYRVDTDILESQGPFVLFEETVKGEIRGIDGMTCRMDESSTTIVVIGVVTKSGTLTLLSLSSDSFDLLGRHERQYSSPVLAISLSNNQLALGTKDGIVEVYDLKIQDSSCARLHDQVLLWKTKRNGPIRACIFHGKYLLFGGYERTLIILNMEQLLTREVEMEATINAISASESFVAVGCRGKLLTVFDTTTFSIIKTFKTSGWVTSISFFDDQNVALRSDATCVSILRLSTTHITDNRLTSAIGREGCLSWSFDSKYLARTLGNTLLVSERNMEFTDVAEIKLTTPICCLEFCPTDSKKHILCTAEVSGEVTLFRIIENQGKTLLEKVASMFVEPKLRALAWSNDGSRIVLGGIEKKLHILSGEHLQPEGMSPITLNGRIWDIQFTPSLYADESNYLAVGLGDYTAVILDENFEQLLRVEREKSVRSIRFHPTLPYLVVGDGGGRLATLDIVEQTIVQEDGSHHRINTIDFSPCGDNVLIGMDNGHFDVHLFEVDTLAIPKHVSLLKVQSFNCVGIACAGRFSPCGTSLAVGATDESYLILSLGPFLGINLVPLDITSRLSELPVSVQSEVLMRSFEGFSLLQRKMCEGTAESRNDVKQILRKHPEAFLVKDAKGRNCVDLLREQPNINLIKIVSGTLLNGSIGLTELYGSIGTEGLDRATTLLMEAAENFPSEHIQDILEDIRFARLPKGKGRFVKGSISRVKKGTDSLDDPWNYPHKDPLDDSHAHKVLFPAILPLPGLATMDFLSTLINHCEAKVFDNQAMSLVLSILWYDHVRRLFLADMAVFMALLALWVVETESSVSKANEKEGQSQMLSIAIIFINTLYAAKEIIQSRCGKREWYRRQLWNVVDISTIIFLYLFAFDTLLEQFSQEFKTTVAVLGTFFLTLKSLSYLRGFGPTGWLISLLAVSMSDVRPFLMVLSIAVAGFALSFRLLFPDLEGFRTLRRALLSTFELTVLGNYEEEMTEAGELSVLSIFAFILAVTTVLIVALNALISILADSFARVQQDAIANKRRERAQLIVEYMSLLPPFLRRRIESSTRFCHILLETDVDGNLVMEAEDWNGGIHAVRDDIGQLREDFTRMSQESTSQISASLSDQVASLRQDMMTALEKMSAEIDEIKRNQNRLNFDGKKIAKVVKAVGSIANRTIIRQTSDEPNK